MIWARRIVAPGEWNEVQDQLESLFVKLGCPGQKMMLVATSGPASPCSTPAFQTRLF
jgi:hypothetical protein